MRVPRVSETLICLVFTMGLQTMRNDHHLITSPSTGTFFFPLLPAFSNIMNSSEAFFHTEEANRAWETNRRRRSVGCFA
jgi:hypothetical protein